MDAAKFVVPQFVCLNCKKVIGPVWDDEEHQCGCDMYEYDVIRLVQDMLVERALELTLNELNWLCCSDKEFIMNRLQYWINSIAMEQSCKR